MVEYQFRLEIAETKISYTCTRNLNEQEENEPKIFFTPQNREELRKELEKQSSCKITDNNLNKIINTWVEDIKDGFRESSLVLPNLTTMLEAEINNLEETGNQDKPTILEPNLGSIEPKLGVLPPLKF